MYRLIQKSLLDSRMMESDLSYRFQEATFEEKPYQEKLFGGADWQTVRNDEIKKSSHFIHSDERWVHDSRR